MGFRIKAATIAGSPQNTVEHRGHRTLAFCARDVNGGKRQMRISKQSQSALHTLKLVNDAATFERVQPIDRLLGGVHRLEPVQLIGLRFLKSGLASPTARLKSNHSCLATCVRAADRWLDLAKSAFAKLRFIRASTPAGDSSRLLRCGKRWRKRSY